LEAELSPAGASVPTDPYGQLVTFATSAAVAGDIVALGVSHYDIPGAVHIFARSAGVWQESAKVVPADGQIGDSFGETVAVSATGSVLVGASYARDSLEPSRNRGAAYYFAQAGGTWDAGTKLFPGTCPMDYFGKSVAAEGSRLVVGGHVDDRCSAYVFRPPDP
jgi:hypothetical protein